MSMSRTWPRRSQALGVAALLLAVSATVSPAAAASEDAAADAHYWTGEGSNQKFSNPANWHNGQVPGAGAYIVFPAQVHDCDEEMVHLDNDLDVAFAEIQWGRFSSDDPDVPVNCSPERFHLVFIFIEDLRLQDAGTSRSLFDPDSVYTTRLVIENLDLDGSLLIDGENLYTARDTGDQEVAAVTDLTIKNGAVVAREREEGQEFFYVDMLFKPSGRVRVGAPGDRFQYNGMFELSPDVIGDIDSIDCLGCELEVGAKLKDRDLSITMRPNEHGSVARIRHSEYYFEPAQTEVTLAAHFVVRGDVVEAYVDEGLLTLKGTREGHKFTNPWGINFKDRTKKLR
jgi:hypothetical protein